jgi:hypothetical protein
LKSLVARKRRRPRRTADVGNETLLGGYPVDDGDDGAHGPEEGCLKATEVDVGVTPR